MDTTALMKIQLYHPESYSSGINMEVSIEFDDNLSSSSDYSDIVDMIEVNTEELISNINLDLENRDEIIDAARDYVRGLKEAELSPR